MNAVVTLAGTLVRLRPIIDADIPVITRWFADPDVRHWLHHSDRADANEDDVRERYGPAAAREREVRWAITTAGGDLIGTVRLEGIDRDHARGELAITIGEKDYWDRGYGTDAIKQALRFGFQNLGLRVVVLITDADNVRGIRCYEKCGFVRAGVYRQHRLRYGRPLDMVMMDVLREAWERP